MTNNDGLCHAYNEYPDLDCTLPAGHDGNHANQEQQ